MQREKYLKVVQNAVLTTPTYPNCKINGQLYYDEKIMSMPTLINNTSESKVFTTIQAQLPLRKGSYFFFV